MNLKIFTDDAMFLIKTINEHADISGRDLYAKLVEQPSSTIWPRWTHTKPAFYQLMSTLADKGAVFAYDDPKIVDGVLIRERRFKLTADCKNSLLVSVEQSKQIKQIVDTIGNMTTIAIENSPLREKLNSVESVEIAKSLAQFLSDEIRKRIK